MNSKIFKIYIALGKTSYRVCLPMLRLFLRKTRRVYVLVLYKDRVLLVKNWLGNDMWALPGGGIKKGETPISALIRETKEEVGINLLADHNRFSLIAEGHWRTDDLGQAYYIFATSFYTDKLDINKKEIISAAWIKLSELNLKNTPQEILDALRKV
jgi:ADP-ribose pyrophosphatase YjhB (NUDIX family)